MYLFFSNHIFETVLYWEKCCHFVTVNCAVERTRALQSVDIVQILALLITCCVPLGKSLFESPFPYLRDGDNSED